MPRLASSPFLVLQVEDSSIDVYMTRRVIEALGAGFSHIATTTGEEALRLVKDASLKPDLILLDINLPGLNGFQVLESLKSDEETKTIPVVIFSSLDADVFRKRAQLLHASSFVKKPSELTSYESTIQSILKDWARANRL